MISRRGRAMPSLYRTLLILPVWIGAIIWMLSWWLQTHHVNSWLLYIPLTLALIYEFILLPSIFLFFVVKARPPARRIAQKNLKVAVISLCVPNSESIDIVERQLKALTEVTYPHDSWILDEGADKDIKKLAKIYEVNYFTRKGIRKYNQPIPPFQKKTKAGNVNAWLEHVKRRKYDYFVQLDIDHIPKPNYLHKTLGFFRDPKVAWVQAPSVYSNRENWLARGAAEQELVLQGPLQMGFYGFSNTPFIIGSHSTYRMKAIREIGGFQPTRAEDHLDTVHLANRGYRGVFLPEIIAEGDGPETLSVYLAQQFAWAYSMFQVLSSHTPKLLKGMPLKRKYQFLFAQTWYPLWSISYLVLFFIPVAALLLNSDVVHIRQGDMLIHFAPLYLSAFLVWWAARPLMQPSNLRLSWRGVILHAVRWPIILRAIISVIFKIKKPYMITPKGKFAKTAPQLKTYRPFMILGLASCFVLLLAGILARPGMPTGQVLFVLSNAGFMLSICMLDIGIRYKTARPERKEFKNYWLKPLAATFAFATLFSVAVASAPSITANTSIFAERARIRQASGYTYRNASYTMSTSELLEHIEHTKKRSDELPEKGMYNQFAVTKPTQSHIQHSFVDWRDDHYLAYVLAQTEQNGNAALITIEPRGNENGLELLEAIKNGSEDKQIKKLAKIIGTSKNQVYVRFAHEMELNNVYPWGNQDPELFIESYRHFSNTLRSNAPLTKFVWSPAGNYGADAYYPGDEYVDVIGTTMLFDQYWYGTYTPPFAYIQEVRNWLLNYEKPVWIVEFGAGRANPEQQKAVIADALASYKSFGYDALVYLNMKDSNLEGPDYRLADVNDFGGFYLPKITVAKQDVKLPVTKKPEVKKPVCLDTKIYSGIYLYLNENPIKTTTQTRKECV